MDSFRKKGERGSHDRYLALLLADGLEAYVHKCNNALDEHQTYRDSRGSAGELMGSIPQTPTIPDEDYKTFNVDLLDRVLEFPQRVELGNSYVADTARFDGDDEANNAAYESGIELANRALSVADQLRAEPRLSVRNLTYGSYDLRQSLGEKQRKLGNKKKEVGGFSLS